MDWLPGVCLCSLFSLFAVSHIPLPSYVALYCCQQAALRQFARDSHTDTASSTHPHTRTTAATTTTSTTPATHPTTTTAETTTTTAASSHGVESRKRPRQQIQQQQPPTQPALPLPLPHSLTEQQQQHNTGSEEEKDEMGLGVWQTVQHTQQQTALMQPTTERSSAEVAVPLSPRHERPHARTDNADQPLRQQTQQQQPHTSSALSAATPSASYSALLASVSSSSHVRQQSASTAVTGPAALGGATMFRKRRARDQIAADV